MGFPKQGLERNSKKNCGTNPHWKCLDYNLVSQQVGQDETIYLQEKPTKGVASATTTSWVWFDRMGPNSWKHD